MNLYFRMLVVLLKSKFSKQSSPWVMGKTSFRVLPNDLDTLGHMNNGRYLTILDLARLDLMLRSGGWKMIRRNGWYPVVAGQTVAFRRSLKPFQKYQVHTRILGVNEHGLYIEQTFCVGQDVYAQAYVRARFLKQSGGKVSEEELLGLFDDTPEHFDIPDWLIDWSVANRRVPKTLEG